MIFHGLYFPQFYPSYTEHYQGFLNAYVYLILVPDTLYNKCPSRRAFSIKSMLNIKFRKGNDLERADISNFPDMNLFRTLLDGFGGFVYIIQAPDSFYTKMPF